ncbi:uncharacterized protein [Aegilops tauschii subsp. strangulata]|uniref:uncharacterized protein isoform X2 n=1 Tax=Triticum aestivum TaxID=4565 RepID=UPI001D02A998|nr:uncharacterized protein LOC123053613 isoform X2 [Triticum aestivum]XP_044333038.1 uncharacterized protein LOC123053615 isoform X2 [Triticum aestivum]
MRSSGDGGNARDGLLAVGSIQGGDEDHMDDIEEEEKAQGCGERNNSNRGIGILPRNLGAEEDVCKGLGDEAMVRRRENYVLIGFEALGACDWLDRWHQQAPAGLGTAVGGYMVGGAHHWDSTSGNRVVTRSCNDACTCNSCPSSGTFSEIIAQTVWSSR